jgi:hypothetical protein
MGKIVRVGHTDDTVSVLMLQELSAEQLLQYSLSKPLAAEYPQTVRCGIIELMLTSTALVINRSCIADIVFVAPLVEVESGFFHLSGADNTFFIRYQQLADNSLVQYVDSLMQARPFDSFSIRIFRHLNQVSSLIRKSFYHQAEADSVSKTFRLPFSYEAFCYLFSRFKGANNNRAVNAVLFYQLERKQRHVIYRDDLSMRSVSTSNVVHLSRFLTKDSLIILRKVLGAGIGVGLGKARPTKARPESYCCINDKITTLEMSDDVPRQYIEKPFCRLNSNGVDFFYTVQTQSLQCNLHYSKVVVTCEQVVLSKIPSASVRPSQMIPYPGAMFVYGDGNHLCIIDSIENGFASCVTLEEDHPPFCLSFNDIIPLLSSFGRQRNRP